MRIESAFQLHTISAENININDVPDDVDIFESVVMQEESFVKAGYLAGLNHGTEKGQQDGYQLGHSLECSVGNEIGFLKGFVSTWLALLDQSPDTKEKNILQPKYIGFTSHFTAAAICPHPR
ncbi:Hypothetical predicted protein [Octopus vulgaris]|uniref:Protein LTO1 homolog n=1 Tax=Octopus vulgaris TaxID=6645 RepID=A0AA36F675_OCTVU|nr:Hypothetical predicted protein [Octopus vulgaris]